LAAFPALIFAAFGASAGHNVQSSVYFGAAGLALGGLGAIVAHGARRSSAGQVVTATVGVLCGGLLALYFVPLLKWGLGDSWEVAALSAGIILWFSLVGATIWLSKWAELSERWTGSASPKKPVAILDTSAIIDARIADVCETGFLTGRLIVPRFVLEELQKVADSSDGAKRARGRRALDTLNRMKKQSFVTIVVDEKDYPNLKDVDQKLIRLAKESGAPLMTNDFNLNKVAEVHSIPVLNLNVLANAMKVKSPPGDILKVRVIKEGKAPGQGIAYLDDGAMVVVENGGAFVGKEVDATVSSVIQTAAGRMIFASVK
jgi:uncharacterized protein YacL